MRAARALREEETVADCEYAERHQDSGRSRSYRPFGVWGQITWACARRTRSAQAIKLRAFSLSCAVRPVNELATGRPFL